MDNATDLHIPAKAEWSLPTWNSYVESATSRELRQARLGEVPDAWRDIVKAHIKCSFQVRANKSDSGK